MGMIIFLVILVAIGWFLMSGSQEGKVVVFLGGVAILAFIGSTIVSFAKYISYVSILAILCMIGYMLFKKLFK